MFTKSLCFDGWLFNDVAHACCSFTTTSIGLQTANSGNEMWQFYWPKLCSQESSNGETLTGTHLAGCFQLSEIEMTFSWWWVRVLRQRSPDLVVTDNMSTCGRRRCPTLPFSGHQNSFSARYHGTALPFDRGVQQEKQKIGFFLNVLLTQWRSGISDSIAPHQSSQPVGRCLEVPILDYTKGSCCIFCELDLLGARVDDKCDSSCHCGTLDFMIVLLIEWSISSCGLWAIKWLHHCWSELLKREANRWPGLPSWPCSGRPWDEPLFCATLTRSIDFNIRVFGLFQAYDVVRVASLKDEVTFCSFAISIAET